MMEHQSLAKTIFKLLTLSYFQNSHSNRAQFFWDGLYCTYQKKAIFKYKPLFLIFLQHNFCLLMKQKFPDHIPIHLWFSIQALLHSVCAQSPGKVKQILFKLSKFFISIIHRSIKLIILTTIFSPWLTIHNWMLTFRFTLQDSNLTWWTNKKWLTVQHRLFVNQQPIDALFSSHSIKPPL